MNAPKPNEQMLLAAVEKLAPLLDQLVFVGGCATGLLITDAGAATVRVTRDVDVIIDLANSAGYGFVDAMLRNEEAAHISDAQVRKTDDVDTIVDSASYTEFTALGARLRELGFRESIREGAPICRWESGDLVLDVMPIDPKVLGFGNRWYQAAFQNAAAMRVGKYEIRTITAPYFLATKLDAYRNRGKNDFQSSSDLEDVVSILDGRPEVIEEVALADPELRKYLGDEFRKLISNRQFVESLPGFLLPDEASQGRIGLILKRMKQLIDDN